MSTHVAGGRPQVLAGGWVRHFPATWVSPSAAHTMAPGIPQSERGHPRQKPQSFYNVIAEQKSCPFCPILFIRDDQSVPMNTEMSKAGPCLQRARRQCGGSGKERRRKSG